MKRAISLLLVFALAACVFAGCRKEPAVDNTTPSTQPTESVGPNVDINVGDVNSETPMYMQWIGDAAAFENPHGEVESLYPYMIFDRLSEVNVKTGVRYWCLAENIEISQDLKVATITLRENAKWHDGQNVTVEDVVFSIYAALLNPDSVLQNIFMNLAGALAVANGETDTIQGIAVEGNVMTLTFMSANATMIDDLSKLAILPKHCFPENVDYTVLDTYDYWKQPIGSGAYKITEVTFGDNFKLTRFDDYWGAKPGIKNVVYKHYDSTDAGAAAVVGNELDFATSHLIADSAAMKSFTEKNASVKPIVTASYNYSSFRFMLEEEDDAAEKSILMDAEVRLAIDLIIDNDALAAVYGDLAKSTYVLHNPESPSYPADLTRESQNIEKALEILNRKGWNFEDELVICYTDNEQPVHDLMQQVQQNLEDAGLVCTVHCAINPSTDTVYTEKNYDLLFVTGESTASDPAARYFYLTTLTKTTIGAEDKRKNRGYDATYNSYIASVGDERIGYAHQLMKLNFEDSFEIPCFVLNSCVVYNSAKIYVPETVFQLDGTTHMEWENWRVLS